MTSAATVQRVKLMPAMSTPPAPPQPPSSLPPQQALTIWCNASFSPAALSILGQQVKPHRLVLSRKLEKSNLVGAGPDEDCRRADIALGQPNLDDLLAS